MGHFRGYLAPHQEQPERPSQFYWDGERFMLLRHSGVLCHGGIHLSHHKQIKSPSWIFRRGSGLRPITPRLTHQSLESQHSSNLTHPLLPGLIAGCYADHFRRDSVIKVAGFLSVLSLGALVVVVLADGPNPKDTIPIPGPLLHSTTLISNPYAIDSFLFSMRLMAPPVAKKTELSPVLHLGFMRWVSTPVTFLGQETDWRFLLLALALCAWSAAGGISNAPMQAIFADSIPTGQRTEVYTSLQIISTLAYGLGPLLAAIAFELIGDEWTLPTLTLIVLMGVALYIPALVTYFMYDDKDTLGLESEAVTVIQEENDQKVTLSSLSSPSSLNSLSS